MLKKTTLGALTLIFSLTNAHCVNYKLLGLEADECVGTIWSKRPYSKEKINESLKSLDIDGADSKYYETTSFQPFYKKFKELVCKENSPVFQERREGFISFAKSCKRIFKEGDSITKAKVYLLLEQVNHKFADIVASAKKSKKGPARTPLAEMSPHEMDSFIEQISNADKFYATSDSSK